jgi:thioredoxin 1
MFDAAIKNSDKAISKKDYPDHVITLDSKNFNVFIEKYPLSVVDFWASWCAPCKAMAPRLRRLSKIYKGKVAFGKIDTQKNQDIAKNYKIQSIPHLVVFNNGKKALSITGLRSVGNLKKTIEEILNEIDD